MLLYLLILLPLLAFSAWASAKVNSAYSAYDQVSNHSHMTGYDTAVRLLSRGGITEVRVARVKGKLTDHYHPTKKVVNLSQSTYGSASIASVAVAAHEVGHVMQKYKGYFPYKIRNFLVPLANVGSRLALPLALLGVVLSLLVESPIGNYVVYVGIAMYGLSTLFMLVTLPVEFDASRRAKQMLVEEGILTQDELPGASRVLSAAAMTYVASLAVSLFYFLRFALVFLSLTRRRR